MSYDNAIRAALRTIKNPTAIPIDVEQLPNGDIKLHVDPKSVKQLPRMRRLAFASYLKDLLDIIQVHGKVNCEVDMRGRDGR
jgi:hypothetical protein